jgi:hypothetical protein
MIATVPIPARTPMAAVGSERIAACAEAMIGRYQMLK